jgi:uncharacterized protein (DUF885 family)
MLSKWKTPLRRWRPACGKALLSAAVVLASACAQAPGPAVVAAPLPFAQWSEQFALRWVRLSPEWATSTQYYGGEEQQQLDSQLGAVGSGSSERWAALARSGLSELNTYPAESLQGSDRISAAILRSALQRSLANQAFEDHGFAFNQMWGLHLRYISMLAENHPLRRPSDVQSFLSRLAQVDQRLDEALVRARQAAARGLLPPRVIVERARTQVQGFLAQPLAANDILSGLARRSANIKDWPAADRQAALDQASALVQNRVLPAYTRVLALLDELLPNASAEVGLWRLPQGDLAYQAALKEYTTTTMGAEDIHALGLREVARIEAQMEQVLQSLGRSQGSIAQRLGRLREELQPPAGSDPRAHMLALYTAAVKDTQQRAQALFNLQPLAPIEVRRVPALTERTASAYYTTPAPDGSRPGVFWAPLPGPSYDLLRLRSLVVHEAVPGHHFQLALQQEQTDLPRWRQRRIFSGGSAHSEGWALYAERLALDNGWYDGDPHALLGGLDGQLFRARRLVVDTGLHAKRWTREQAIDYGLPSNEVERYIANPGQATAYMVGMLHILALRDEAQKTMGERFSLKDFHDLVLKTGSVPLDVLSEVVRTWARGPTALAR